MGDINWLHREQIGAYWETRAAQYMEREGWRVYCAMPKQPGPDMICSIPSGVLCIDVKRINYRAGTIDPLALPLHKVQKLKHAAEVHGGKPAFMLIFDDQARRWMPPAELHPEAISVGPEAAQPIDHYWFAYQDTRPMPKFRVADYA